MKKTLIFLTLSLTALISSAQTTAIPDANFEQALISLGLDTLPIDGLVLTANINTITSLNVISQSINNLTGIEDFTALDTLKCSGNGLTNLDLSQNTALTFLICSYNYLTNLNVSQNTALFRLQCGDNQLTNLNVTQNTALNHLSCWGNLLTSLDVTQNTSLTYLNCSENPLGTIDVTLNSALSYFHCRSTQLTTLDVSQNTSLTHLNCERNQLVCLNVKNGNNSNFSTYATWYNPYLRCVEVDDISYSINNWGIPITNTHSYYSDDCFSLCTVGIDESSPTDLSIYPNPNTGSINIDLGVTLSNLTITIINNLGQSVFSKNYESTDFIGLDFDAPTGVYFLQLQAENGKVITNKIAKE
ncbi:MAG: T9SS type A sorting domain-containing protein [Vicingaceae bacterium]|nr:T9SS type A sorting domain-containing protein [Vicingaceae bacterium]